MRQNITLDEMVEFLSRVEGFSEISERDLVNLIVPMINIATFEPGQPIIKKGTEGRDLYVLYRGKARVDVQTNEGHMLHFDMNVGAVVGELSLVSNQLRTADVIAETQAIMLVIDIETFQELMSENWRVTQVFAALIGRRVLNKYRSARDK